MKIVVLIPVHMDGTQIFQVCNAIYVQMDVLTATGLFSLNVFPVKPSTLAFIILFMELQLVVQIVLSINTKLTLHINASYVVSIVKHVKLIQITV